MPNEFFSINNLSLKNFRIFSKLNCNLQAKIIFITGDNGSGKTSILESIYIANFLKSFRNAKEQYLIKSNEKFYNIDIQYNYLKNTNTCHIGYGDNLNGNKERSLIINHKKITKIVDYIGKLPCIIFSPNDLDIINTSHSERRKFFDMTISLFDKKYFIHLQNYKKIIKMRSEILKKYSKQKINIQYLSSLNEDLVSSGYYIQEARKIFISKFQNIFYTHLKLISNEKDIAYIYYRPSIVNVSSSLEYRQKIESNLAIDLYTKQTTLGIHRDKIIISNENNLVDIQKIASQGQKRSIAIALKMTQYQYIQDKLNKKPILLVDDILNELDISRKEAFIKFLENSGSQTILTTTDLEGLSHFIKKLKEKSQTLIYKLYPDNTLETITI